MKLYGADRSLNEQIDIFEAIIKKNPDLVELLEKLGWQQIPDWYIGGGSLFQTVWNVSLGRDPREGIEDYDIVYFDPDTTYEAEDRIINRIQKAFPKLPLDIKNQARIHLWAKERFGVASPEYTSVEEAIADWGITCTSVGIRKYKGHKLIICAPYGLNDIFNMCIKLSPECANRIIPRIYYEKVEKWLSKFPQATHFPHPGE